LLHESEDWLVKVVKLYDLNKLTDENMPVLKGFYNNYASVVENTYTKPDAFSVRCVKEK